MASLTINGNTYKIKFGYNCFCDTNLLDRVNDMTKLLNGANAENDNDIAGIGKIKELFLVVRDLVFYGFEKYNPVDDVSAVGNILDEYMDEEVEEERGLFQLFTLLSEELTSEGFLSNLLPTTEMAVENQKKVPQDHKKKLTVQK